MIPSLADGLGEYLKGVGNFLNRARRDKTLRDESLDFFSLLLKLESTFFSCPKRCPFLLSDLTASLLSCLGLSSLNEGGLAGLEHQLLAELADSQQQDKIGPIDISQ